MKKLVPVLSILLVVLTACPHKKDVIDTNTDRKVGYLFYTAFIDNYNNSLYETFARFKKEKVTDLVVDLRYNHGGSLDAASYLASLIAPQSVVQNSSVFTRLDFNDFMNAYFDGRNESRDFTLQPEVLGANLNLKTVYIIATDDSYSAAELLTFCLKPYMNVVHIGSKTGGKYTASMTITAYDDYENQTNTIYDATKLSVGAKDSLRDWGMQPIVAIYTDSRGANFSATDGLMPTIEVTSHENDDSYYKPIGDISDYLLAAAMNEITGSDISATQNAPTIRRSVTPGLKPAKLFSKKDRILTESVRIPRVYAASSATTSTGINTISRFVYDGMSTFYKWADNMESKVPTIADQNPAQYFESVLEPVDTQHGWSWITDDVNGLLSDFAGSPLGFGWGLQPLWADPAQTKVVAIIQYVYPNTPASRAGIKRGDVIKQINGVDMTNNEEDLSFYGRLSGRDAISVTVIGESGTKTISIAPTTISTNPVLKDTIYTIPRK